MKSLSRVTLTLFSLQAFSLSLHAEPAGGQELLEFVRDAHRASREAIRTLACRVEFSGTLSAKHPPQVQTCNGDFWYSHDAVRGKYSEFDKEQDFLWKDSICQTVLRRSDGSKQLVGAHRAAYANRYVCRCDPYVAGLLVLNLPGTIEYVPFEELVKESARLIEAKRTTVDGHKAIVIRLGFNKRPDFDATWIVEIQFDPEINYLVRRTTYIATNKNGQLWREAEVVQLREFSDGVFFPEKAVGRSGPDGKVWDFNYTAILSKIRVNEPLPDSIFHFNYPNGIHLTDTIRNTRYTVDSEGNATSVETALATVPPPPSAATLDQGMFQTETQEEPLSPLRWVAPISLCIAILGMAGLLYRRLRPTNRR
jgi:hypothetical protein